MNPSLRNILYFDAATCTGTGLVLASLAAPLSPMLGLPDALLQCAGLVRRCAGGRGFGSRGPGVQMAAP